MYLENALDEALDKYGPPQMCCVPPLGFFGFSNLILTMWATS